MSILNRQKLEGKIEESEVVNLGKCEAGKPVGSLPERLYQITSLTVEQVKIFLEECIKRNL